MEMYGESLQLKILCHTFSVHYIKQLHSIFQRVLNISRPCSVFSSAYQFIKALISLFLGVYTLNRPSSVFYQGQF